MDAPDGGVEGELADGNAHAAGALIAEPEDALAVAHHDGTDAVIAPMGQDPGDAVPVGKTENEAAGLVPDLAEALAALAHGGRIDQRQHLLDIVDQELVEQGLVGILEIAQEGVFLEGRLIAAQRRQAAGRLLLQASDMRRQQAMEIEGVALLLGEGRPLVQHGLVEEIEAGEADLERPYVPRHVLTPMLRLAAGGYTDRPRLAHHAAAIFMALRVGARRRCAR